VLRLEGVTVFAADLVEHHERVDTQVTCAGIGPGTIRSFTVVSLERVEQP
jgi:hypothetical protein